MTGLRDIAHRIARGAPTAGLVSDRLLTIERVVAGLANRRLPAAVSDPLAARMLRHRLATLWTVGGSTGPVLAAVCARAERSCDRAAIIAYLLHYPHAHPDFATLRETVALAAGRHDWPWRDRGHRWRLWEGPGLLAAAGPAAWADAGLIGRLAQGGFARAVAAENRVASG